MSAFVLNKTCLKHAEQNRLELENAFRGLGMSKHFSPLLIEEPQPRQGLLFPAIALTGTPAEPLISEGILFFDILQLLNFPRQSVQDFSEANHSDSELLRCPCRALSTGAETFVQLFIHHLERSDKVILGPYVRLELSRNFNAGWKKPASV